MSKSDNQDELGAIIDEAIAKAWFGGAIAKAWFGGKKGKGGAQKIVDETIHQIEDFYRNKIPKKVNAEMPNATTVAYNRAIDDITAQFNKGDSDE